MWTLTHFHVSFCTWLATNVAQVEVQCRHAWSRSKTMSTMSHSVCRDVHVGCAFVMWVGGWWHTLGGLWVLCCFVSQCAVNVIHHIGSHSTIFTFRQSIAAHFRREHHQFNVANLLHYVDRENGIVCCHLLQTAK